MGDGKVVIDITADDKAFKRELGGLGGAVKSGLAGMAKIGAAAGAVLGLALVGAVGLVAKKGIDRALNIEDAKSTMKSLGYVADEVDGIVNNVLNAVKGTAYALDEGMGAAASSLAAGIKPGKELEGWVRLIGDAATVTKDPFGEIANIFNQVQGKGVVMGEELTQLAERGLPVLAWLAEAYGVSRKEMSDMVSAGKVDAATFRKVVEENIGGAALNAGDTTRGAMKNVEAAIGRAGEKLAGGLLEPARDALKTLIGEIDALGPDLTTVGQALTELITGESVDTSGARYGEAVVSIEDKLVNGLTSIAEKITEGLTSLLPALVRVLAAVIVAVTRTLPSLLPPLVAAFVDGLTIIVDALPGMLPALLDAFKQVIVVLAEAMPVILPALVAAFAVLIPLLAEVIDELLPVIMPLLITAMQEMGVVLLSNAPLFLKAGKKLLLGLLKGLWEGLKTLLSQAPGMWKRIVDSITPQLPRWMQMGVKSLRNFLDGMKEKFADVREWVAGIPDRLVKAIGSVSSKFQRIGREISNGIKDGIRSAWDGLVSRLKGLVDLLPESVKRILKIASPSKVFTEIGAMMMEGMRVGITGNAARVVRAVGSVVSRSISAAMLTPGGFGGIVPGGWSPLVAFSGSTGGVGSSAPATGKTIHVEQNIYTQEVSYAESKRGALDAARAAVRF